MVVEEPSSVAKEPEPTPKSLPSISPYIALSFENNIRVFTSFSVSINDEKIFEGKYKMRH